MSTKDLHIAKSYYDAMNKKSISSMEKMLSPNVLFIGPVAKLEGKEAVVKAIKGFTSAFTRLQIREEFAQEGKVMLAIDTEFPEPIGHLRTASLLNIEDGLITKIELFYDSNVIESKKDQVFSK